MVTENVTIGQVKRKNCDILICSGIGIIIMTIWLGVKALAFIALASGYTFDSVLDKISYHFSLTWEQYLFVYTLIALEAFVRGVIGFKSVSLGRQRKDIPVALIVVTFALTLYACVYDVLEIYETIRVFSLAELFYCFLDVFFLYPLIHLDISFLKLRKVYRVLRETGKMKTEAQR